MAKGRGGGGGEKGKVLKEKELRTERMEDEKER